MVTDDDNDDVMVGVGEQKVDRLQRLPEKANVTAVGTYSVQYSVLPSGLTVIPSGQQVLAAVPVPSTSLEEQSILPCFPMMVRTYLRRKKSGSCAGQEQKAYPPAHFHDAEPGALQPPCVILCVFTQVTYPPRGINQADDAPAAFTRADA
jgi:hypothetical protein